ncbi:MAG: ABC transporter substrate-binding protein [Candidatus Schekmanbacteria bacterium]|nr:ABC transporter substrate-binding protein [Candidatus Schekmanbacteria bacterium]
MFKKILLLIITISLLTNCQARQSPILPELKVGLESNPTNLDPRLASDAMSARVTQIVFNSLVRLNAQAQLTPELAEKWEMPDDVTYVFYLRRGVKFQDGQELIAQDVEYTYQSILAPESLSPRRSSYEVIKRIELIDDYTIKFSLHRPFAPFLLNMTMAIIPRHLGNNPDFSRHPVGSGPFQLMDWQPDEQLVFRRHDRYFEGKPPLERIIYKIIPEDTTRVLALKKADLDLVQNAVPPDLLANLEAESHLQVLRKPGTTYEYLAFNLRDKILGQKKVRQAIAMSIDRPIMVHHLLIGLGTLAQSLLPAGNWAYNANLPETLYNPEQARKLLDEAGFPDPDGAGPQVRFNLVYKTSQNELSRRKAEVIQADLKNVGIGVEINSYEWGSFFADISAGNFQLCSLQWVGVTDPDIYYYIFHSQSIPPNGANRGHYLNPALDRLLEQGRQTLDEGQRSRIYQQVQQIIADDLPYVSLWHNMNVVVMNKRVQGFEIYPAGDFTSLKRAAVR